MPQDIPRHQRPTKLDKFLFGVAYYPEHWTAGERADDARLMAEAGVNVVRMAEFAWDRIERRRGKFDFSLFDQAIAELGKAGIGTILCTPTATPPRWLTAGKPDWMRVDESGRRMEHGSRQHCCTTNEGFRAESRRITAAMAEHYAANSHVIGWQTDNELNCHFSECFCPACAEAFRGWLRRRYASIDALNAAWGTAFWAQTYGDFDQVPLPYPNSRPAYPNPSHELDYYRFLSDMVIEFQRQQVHILRAANGRWWITHNGLFRHIDYWKFTEDLDFLGVDVYPGFSVARPADSVWPAVANQRCRSVCGGYVVPEQQSGPGGQKPYFHANPAGGQMRLWAYQSIAHGADGVLHFRWRTCRFGAEQYWCGVLDHDNIPRRRYRELAQEGAELARIGRKVLGTVGDVQAAVLIDTEQNEAHQAMHLGLPSPQNQADLAYREFWRRHLPCGLVQLADSFEGLKLVVLPSMPMMDQALAGKLGRFVEQGGTLLVTARSATRDYNNHVLSATPPGLLSALCGARVEEFGRLEPGAKRMRLGAGEAPSGAGYEVISLQGAQQAAAWLAPADGSVCAAGNRPAAAVRQAGAGRAIYVGTYLSDDNASAIIELALAHSAVRPLAQAEEGVEVTRRHGGGRSLVFALNHHPTPQRVNNLPDGQDLITGQRCAASICLPPYGVAIIEERPD